MIKYFKVTKLFGKQDVELTFNKDLNILTGKNGSGKTTIIKLIWYLLSGNIERALPEISFESAILETDKFRLEIYRGEKEGEGAESIKCSIQESNAATPSVFSIPSNDESDMIYTVDERIVSAGRTSIFFPTFRRIEGGFALKKRRIGSRVFRAGSELDGAITDYSKMMSSTNHKFVASISTNDIEVLLTRRYADLSETTNRLHEALSTQIERMISSQETQEGGVKSEKETLEKIRKFVQSIAAKREEIMRPFNVFSSLISDIFKDKGIQIDVFKFHETKGLISSGLLSAGEKQMLSFLCYNAFSSDCSIFIDEPEISLHVDWQRLLFPTLLRQATANQFIISTHSPFIYSKYVDRELILNPDKGDN